jgi:hypothetical protein
MRGLFIILLLTCTTRLFGQEIEIITTGDSTIVRATNIASNPFMFGDNPLISLLKLNPKMTIQTFNNRHVDNKVDTAFTLTIGNDSFEIYKWTETENGLLNATVTTSKFITKHGLQIGMRKTEVIEKLKKYGLKSIPGQLILENMEIYELLTLKFTGDSLTRIEFQGYMD